MEKRKISYERMPLKVGKCDKLLAVYLVWTLVLYQRVIRAMYITWEKL